MIYRVDLMPNNIEGASNRLGPMPNNIGWCHIAYDDALTFDFSFRRHSKVEIRGKAMTSSQKALAVLLGGFAVLLGTIRPGFTQQGPTGASCTAYMNEKVVARYNCLAGTDQSGSVNFIQWEDGTASTGLGGWVRRGKNRFAASEEPRWKICRN